MNKNQLVLRLIVFSIFWLPWISFTKTRYARPRGNWNVGRHAETEHHLNAFGGSFGEKIPSLQFATILQGARKVASIWIAPSHELRFKSRFQMQVYEELGVQRSSVYIYTFNIISSNYTLLHMVTNCSTAHSYFQIHKCIIFFPRKIVQRICFIALLRPQIPPMVGWWFMLIVCGCLSISLSDCPWSPYRAY